jgi:hypothetical protein
MDVVSRAKGKGGFTLIQGASQTVPVNFTYSVGFDDKGHNKAVGRDVVVHHNSDGLASSMFQK